MVIKQGELFLLSAETTEQKDAFIEDANKSIFKRYATEEKHKGKDKIPNKCCSCP